MDREKRKEIKQKSNVFFKILKAFSRVNIFVDVLVFWKKILRPRCVVETNKTTEGSVRLLADRNAPVVPP